jgi:cytoskeletal protein CcmA (bactofilin family)
MAIFGRTKSREGETVGAPDAESALPHANIPHANPGAPMREADDFGLPPIRPVHHEVPPMTLAPKPSAIPAAPGLTPGMPARPGTPAIGVPARPPKPEGMERRTLVVGRGISLQGTVADAERLVVEGTVESQMIQAAELFVAQAGVFRGEVQVEDAEIAGLFDGTLTVRGNLVIRGTGKVNGVARYRKLSVEEGGQVSGRMEMLTEAAAAGSAAPHVPTMRVAIPQAVEADA